MTIGDNDPGRTLRALNTTGAGADRLRANLIVDARAGFDALQRCFKNGHWAPVREVVPRPTACGPPVLLDDGVDSIQVNPVGWQP